MRARGTLAAAAALAAGAPCRPCAAAEAPAVFNLRVVQEFAHDTTAFTEGLVFRDGDGALLESTGLNDKSFVRVFDVDLGKAELALRSSAKLPSRHFGEGITFWNDKLVSLTWKSGTVHVMDQHSLEEVETLDLDPGMREGWGLTPSLDHTALVAGDGSSVLHTLRRSGSRLAIQDSITVHDCANDMPYVVGINELELVPRVVTHPAMPHRIRGAPAASEELLRRRQFDEVLAGPSANRTKGPPSDLIWGNIITTMCVAAINPDTGAVEAWILLDGIYSNWDKFRRVANGIAFRSVDQTLWVTGKEWSKLFRVELEAHPSPASANIKERCTTAWRSFSFNVDTVVGRQQDPSPCEVP